MYCRLISARDYYCLHAMHTNANIVCFPEKKPYSIVMCICTIHHITVPVVNFAYAIIWIYSMCRI